MQSKFHGTAARQIEGCKTSINHIQSRSRAIEAHQPSNLSPRHQPSNTFGAEDLNQETIEDLAAIEGGDDAWWNNC